MDGKSEGSSTVDNYVRHRTSIDIVHDRCRREAAVKLTTIDVFPDDVLLEIFDFHIIDNTCFQKSGIECWIVLAHVCRRWRRVLFQYPRHFNLRLYCTPRTPRDTMDVWPPLPLIISDGYGLLRRGPVSETGVDNITAALERNDRVCQIYLHELTGSQFGYVTGSAAMQNSFPGLIGLSLSLFQRTQSDPILPDSFLGGTALGLRSLKLTNVAFPGLPGLLSSATHLVRLILDCPRHISLDAMATSISALTSLEALHLAFLPFYFGLETRRQPQPPLTRPVLSALTTITYTGPDEFLEAILARIDAPRLNDMYIEFNKEVTDASQLFQFISRSPTLREPERGCISLDIENIRIRFSSRSSDWNVLVVDIKHEWMLSSFRQVCISPLPPVSTLEDLYLHDIKPPWRGEFEVEITPWPDILHSFTTLKNLYLTNQILLTRISPALQELVEGGRATEALPTLKNIFLDKFQPSGPLPEGIQKFVDARLLTSHPVEVSRWDRGGGFYDPDY